VVITLSVKEIFAAVETYKNAARQTPWCFSEDDARSLAKEMGFGEIAILKSTLCVQRRQSKRW